MPCAGGESCLLPNLTPKQNETHGCRGGCGGRLHGTCGDVEDPAGEDNPLHHRICTPCASASILGKHKKAGATGGKQTPAKIRQRLSLAQKFELGSAAAAEAKFSNT